MDKELQRARQIAALEYQAFVDDLTRCYVLKAIEVRLNGTTQPDVSFLTASGVRTQGGYLFFIEDLGIVAERQQTL